MIMMNALNPSCPRCGYDQSGTVETWTDHCPVYGQCPECGTRFEWAVLLDPTRVDLPWLVEHTRGWWGLVRRTPGMVGRLVWPRWFWRPVGIHARIGLSWLGCWCVGTLLILHLLTGVGLVFAELQSLRLWYPPNVAVSANDRAQVLFDALAGPLLDADAKRSPRVVPMAPHGGNWQPPPPSLLSGLRSLSVSFGRVPMLFLAILAFSLMWVINLTVMPVTRRAAKLRAAHVVRAAIISVWVALLSVELERVAEACWAAWPGTAVGSVIRIVLPTLQVFAFVWTAVWWGSAARTAWSLPQARLTIVLTTLAGLLAAAALTLWVDMNRVLNWLGGIGLWSVW